MLDVYNTNEEQNNQLIPQNQDAPFMDENNVPDSMMEAKVKLVQKEQMDLELKNYIEKSESALDLMDDIILKNYLSKLSQYDIVPMESVVDEENVRLFKINKMVYEKDEYATDKFMSIVNAMTYAKASTFLMVDGYEDHTDFYLGIKSHEGENKNSSSIEGTLKNALKGQFPGVTINDELSGRKAGKDESEQTRLLKDINGSVVSISSCVGIPAYRNSKGEYTNANFIQGIEKLAIALQGKRYTSIILATNIVSDEIKLIKKGYENVYTQLSANATQQLSYSTNESLANAISRTKGYSDTTGTSHTEGSSHSVSDSTTKTSGTSSSQSHTEGESSENNWSKFGKLAGPLMNAGSILTLSGVGAPLGIALMAAGGIAGIGGVIKGKQVNKSDTIQEGKNESVGVTHGITDTTNKSDTTNESHTEQFSETDGKTSTVGSSKNFTITIQNKQCQSALKRIDKQLERIEMCEGTGMWATAAYFLSYNEDRSGAETAATLYRSIIQGEQSGVETSAINVWYNENKNFNYLKNYITTLEHPSFTYISNNEQPNFTLQGVSMLTSKELSIMIGLPRKSVPGLPVVEHSTFAKEVVKFDDSKSKEAINIRLGNIFDQGVERKNNPVSINLKSMASHTFVTGSTGCGKSNTIYHLIHQIQKNSPNTKFLVIEPAKGEYKNVFGNVNIYGTNPLKMKPLQINPFAFAKGVHVLEHVDRLVEIFNVCWPMYAAMPAVLKKAILLSYENCGWDMYNSTNKHSDKLFPTFADVLKEIRFEVKNSAFSEEVKSNYEGSLVTRIESLTNGINKIIFCDRELGDKKLFDEDVIVDISSVGSQETKSLIMGILIMRLNEYRANTAIEANSELRHVTILEEAHNILKRCSQEQSMEGSNVAGKSVEMISNAIAEMRTYGEGFIIVDQSPSAVDVSAIKNTNTKIIMRLPEENDRRTSGKSAALKDNQIDEIAKLPTGVAVVYQNNWEEPVLCQINEYKGDKIMYNTSLNGVNIESDTESIIEILKFLLAGRVTNKIDFDIDKIIEGLNSSNIATQIKWKVYECISEYSKTNDMRLWKDNHFEELSELVGEIFNTRKFVSKLTKEEKSFEGLDLKLVELITNRFDNYPKELVLVTEQCLMMDYAWGDKVALTIYNGWYQTVKNRML